MSGQIRGARLTIFRSLLFVPGARPDRFDKAAAAGADTVIIDLEDAVLPEDKARARADALGWLAGRGKSVRAGLRINSPRTADGCADIAALAQSGSSPDFVMVPKAESGVDTEIVSEALNGGAPLIAVVESGRGLEAAYEIAAASKAGVLFGGADLSAEFGVSLEWEPMAYPRGRIVAACAAAGVPAYDVPYLDVKDAPGLEAETGRSRKLGYSGRACIHPAQVPTVNTVFSPSAAEVAEAQAIVDAMEAARGGAALHKGKLIDRPVVLAAERLLALAAR